MPFIRLQNENGDRNVYYEFDPNTLPLGEGGMGRVFRGLQIDRRSRLTRDVAIKMMFDDLPDHVIERARREASIRIVNENILEMIDFVEVHERDAYGKVTATHYHVVSEFLDGVNLDELLLGKTANRNGVTNQTAAWYYSEYLNNRAGFVGKVFRNILSGIMALHDAGYIHRDIDPSNIMITSDGKIKLIDFGIAREVNAVGLERHLTNTGQFIGKPYYAAPELVLGDLAHQDYRTDIYALGIMLFQLTTGHLPFDGAMHEVCDRQLHDKLPLSEVKDKGIRKIIAKATDKKQDKRYQTAAEMRVAIDRWMMGNPSFVVTQNKPAEVKRQDTPVETKPKKERPKREKEIKARQKTSNSSWKILVAASVVLLVVAGGVWLFNVVRSNQATTPMIVENQKKPEEKVVETTPKPAVEKEQPLKEIKTTDKAINLLMNKTTAQEGLMMLNDLVKQGDYRATFLKSRLYFDPSGNSNDQKFYDANWSKMRQNCGLSTDNSEAHRLLMKAYGIKDNDYVALYQLGCDFMSGKRGCERNAGCARWCFDQAFEALGVDNSELAEQYRKEIKNKLGRLSSAKPVKP